MLRTADKRLFVGQQVREAFRGGHLQRGEPWLAGPVPPVSGAVCWLDPSRTDSVTESGRFVSQVDDLTGTGNHFVQASGIDRPFLVENAINGLPALGFQQGEWLTCAGLSRADKTQTTFIVAMVRDLLGFYGLVGCSVNGGNAWRVQITTGKLLMFRPGTGTLQESTQAVVAKQPFVAVQVMSDESLELRLDGASTSGAAVYALTASSAVLAATTPGGEIMGGLIGEVLVYGTTLSSGDIEATEAYLKGKWGTP